MANFTLILESILISAIFVIPAIFLDLWVAKLGLVRADKASIIIVTILLVFTKQVIFKETSWFLFGIVLVAALTLGVHREDFAKTLKLGRWWWKSQKDKV